MAYFSRLLFVVIMAAALLNSATPASASDDSGTLGSSEETATANSAMDSANSESATADSDEEHADEAQSDASQDSEDSYEQPAPPPQRLGNLSKLQVHGFLTQAYATADFVGNRIPFPDGSDPGPTFDELALGIPEDGTFEYRTIALQFRYEITPRDIMVVQFSSRALGESPIEGLEDEVELDWAFYERRLADHTSVKVGRVQIPLGIFNEIRDVGTILPFYRPPFLFYREGTFTNETVDGLVLSHTFWPESNWSLETDFFIGNWETFELTPLGDEEASIANDQGFGTQLWLNTPVTGVRVGFGIHTRDRTDGAEGVIRAPGAESRFEDWYASAEGSFSKGEVRAELRQFSGDPEFTPAFGPSDFQSNINSWYLQAGYFLTDKFRVYGQWQKTESYLGSLDFTRGFTVSLQESYGLSLNYAFNPNLVVKAEHHIVDGEDFSFIPTTPFFFPLEPVVQDLDQGSRTIISLSVSF